MEGEKVQIIFKNYLLEFLDEGGRTSCDEEKRWEAKKEGEVLGLHKGEGKAWDLCLR